jgi:hypothetical protein
MNTHFTSHPEPPRSAGPAGTAAARPGAGARVWAGAIIVAGGLGLIVLGGCFLYGVLELVRPGPLNPGPHEGASSAVSVLLVILYVMAFACFAAAVGLLAVGLWGLTRILLEKPSPPEPDACLTKGAV